MILCLIYALSVAGSARAQVLNRILSDPQLTQDLLEELISIEEAVGEMPQAHRLEKEIEALKPSILEDLRWSGQLGYLLEVRAFVDATGMVRLLSSPIRCGSAGTPADALALHLADGTLGQGEIDGLRFSGPKSHFVWITRHRTFFGLGPEKISEGVIPGELAAGLWADTATLIASKAVVAQLKERRNAEALTNAVERAKSTMENRQQQAVLAQSLERTQQYQSRLRDINRELDEKLDRLSRTRRLANELKMLQGVVTLGTVVGRINAIAMPGTPMNNLSSMPAVLSWLTQYESEIQRETQALTESLQRQQAALQAERNILEQSLINQGMPRTILY